MGKSDPAWGEVILAAGGLVWRESPRGREIAVIHRPRHQDWTLPKGKLDHDERWQDGALREVEEETGFDVELGGFAGSCSYMTRNAPKVVLYWHMQLTGKDRFAPDDPEEVDRLEWLSCDAALARLSHDRERRVLAEAVAGTAPAVDTTEVPAAVPPAQGSKLLRWLLQHTSHRP